MPSSQVPVIDLKESLSRCASDPRTTIRWVGRKPAPEQCSQLLLNRRGDCLAAKLRPGHGHSAENRDGWYRSTIVFVSRVDYDPRRIKRVYSGFHQGSVLVHFGKIFHSS